MRPYFERRRRVGSPEADSLRLRIRERTLKGPDAGCRPYEGNQDSELSCLCTTARIIPGITGAFMMRSPPARALMAVAKIVRPPLALAHRGGAPHARPAGYRLDRHPGARPGTGARSRPDPVSAREGRRHPEGGRRAVVAGRGPERTAAPASSGDDRRLGAPLSGRGRGRLAGPDGTGPQIGLFPPSRRRRRGPRCWRSSTAPLGCSAWRAAAGAYAMWRRGGTRGPRAASPASCAAWGCGINADGPISTPPIWPTTPSWPPSRRRNCWPTRIPRRWSSSMRLSSRTIGGPPSAAPARRPPPMRRARTKARAPTRSGAARPAWTR